ncbi:HAMP domain-containing sensor histidine kinase [Paenibacillus sp. BSR1-1]|uniref:sensor histidine kinase n=1 Tax=Paenibacillus sp. BSR1-1 TaxID=3020845 RepID=UPI0025B10A60|nr:HAMP domain-containing sensor histidine kinase [Paenibacillus sp. BSR1-1]MDN3019706.1 HAMP domain-containing sensor histidine kinase [Paenibacillus sp. BSR1-1]
MNKISFKIGLLFFVAIFLLESISMFFLHDNIIHSRVHDELSALQTRGNNHREILEASFHEETIRHIAMMEARTDTQVILTTPEDGIYMSSNKVTDEMKKILKRTPKNVPHNGLILEDDWKHATYIASISPVIIDNKVKGYVYMFQNTQKIKDLISELNRHFLLAGLLSLLFMMIIIVFLTRAVTHPLIKMSDATKRISKGDFSVSLPKLGKDEMGELGESIKVLASDLEILKNERNEFLASISHELRTPLTYIKGYAEIARRGDTTAADRDNYLGIIHEEAVKLAKLVKDLFNLAKMDENSFSIEKEEVHLLPYFQGIIEKVSPALKENNMQLLLSCPSELYKELDPIRFEQVIVNLLDNARKYSEPHTKITVTVNQEDDKLHIAVRDEGKGIPEKDLARIFERFYRVDKSRTRALGGSGLGLSIVQQLVEAHGGTIEVFSNLNVGTTFKILF